MNPLIITATPNHCWFHPEVEYPVTVEGIAEEGAKCREAGASILHTHCLADIGDECGTKGVGKWADIINETHKHSDILVQCGMSTLTLAQRIEAFEAKADMVSIMLSHHDEDFAEFNNDVLHPMEELVEYAKACRKYRVKPEFEVWHAGSIWNLNYLISQGLLDGPYICSLFFGWPGGTWTPPTVEEYMYRRRLMPENCQCVVSIMGEEQIDVAVAAIRNGDGVRVGTEDHPINQQGKLCNTVELVREMANISRCLGREVATPAQAREMLGIYN